MAVQTLMAKAEFKQLPEGPPYYEYEYGQVIEMPRPHPWHNRVLHRLIGPIDAFVTQHGIGEVFMDSEVDLTQDLVYAPDFIFIRKEHLPGTYGPSTGEIIGVPDLVVEIVSPSHPDRDRIRKFAEYERVGVAWLWLIEAFALSVEEYHLENGHYVRVSGTMKGETFRPQLFPGMEVNLLQLVGEPPAMLLNPVE